MRRWHVVLLIGSLALAAVVLGFAIRSSADTARRAAAASKKADAATAVYVAADREALGTRPASGERQYRPLTPHPLTPHRLKHQDPRLRSATRANRGRPGSSDFAPPLPSEPEPTIPPDIAAVADGPDPCQTDPPPTLDECARMLSAQSMLDCIQYRVDCYG